MFGRDVSSQRCNVVHKSFGRLVLHSAHYVCLGRWCVQLPLQSDPLVCLLPLAARLRTMQVESSAMQLAGRIAGSLFMSVLVVVPLCDHASMALVVRLCALQ